ncbi:MAG: type II toxin-antitoxin system RelE/ParE family toxin [Microcystis aeruginosa K13-05]|jgi:mRNA interferase RelE/StbE|uniref:Plasmid stabilization system n=1 Tax=Microcystis aeruginosa PCC 9717 TaxID=1160286 RepID=I4FWL6_MICAE|nr:MULTISPECIES: type II toxin-antitoxin system RelE/ParE family toxin [Microcystis]MCE2662347.1 type II toxin-antitoxin system RelE/ParE family toxin [Microcystis sp. 53602_E8]MCZ8362017.1 type II toxin-antitoxin system RelE/ParE family toxin [Microcystis sp. LE19-251.1A]MDJ0543876.1 type II toxin-antitoxin system RelE/ParE family toxin [Microcystis sp. M53601_WE4]MDJ0564726.1 type II toxin-antitoxin system RelE/ParE family toxin [Microcystis sp. M49629_WE12]NCR81405.1 type II toxin-antitoxin
MQVEFRRLFFRDLGAINDRKLRQRIESVIAEVEAANSLAELRNIKAIESKPSYYRLRIGDYRVGIYIEDNIIAFVRVLHRKEMYRYFP